MRCATPITTAWDLDTWVYMCRSDQPFVESPLRIVASLSAGQKTDVTDKICELCASILPTEFMNWKQNRFYRGEPEKLKFERRERNALEVFVACRELLRIYSQSLEGISGDC